ncbi:MAG: ATP-binding protein [Bacteroidales bacterium]|nr:ATP-binding protein [Bacteroidales bacterium]
MYPRDLTKEILNKIHSREIIFMLGTRQAGKTTLTKLIAAASNFDKNHIFFFDFEDKEYRALFNLKNAGVQTLKNILKIEGVNHEEKSLLIFDEIQLLTDPSNFLKLLYDYFPNLKVIATGSSSLKIKHKFSDSLAGRKIVYEVEPLNFNEFLLFRGEDKLLKIRKLFSEEKNKKSLKAVIESQHGKFLQLLEEYLIYGGYPEVTLLNFKNDKVEKLHSIADSYIKKDIRDIAGIKNIDAYNNLLKYLSVNTGNLINISSSGTYVGISSATIMKYIYLLKETFIIDELIPFFINKNKEISKNKKIYFKDSGIRNLQIKNFNNLDIRTDAGILYENYVFNRLEMEHDILINNYFYRTQSKTEIDFISEKESSLLLVEVKSGRFNKRPKALFEFEKKYKSNFLQIKKMLINQSYYNFSGDISYIPAYLI